MSILSVQQYCSNQSDIANARLTNIKDSRILSPCPWRYSTCPLRRRTPPLTISRLPYYARSDRAPGALLLVLKPIHHRLRARVNLEYLRTLRLKLPAADAGEPAMQLRVGMQMIQKADDGPRCVSGVTDRGRGHFSTVTLAGLVI